MKRNHIILALLSILLISCQSEIKVACVGDSITNGSGKTQSSYYPSQLGIILGENYQVLNCGESGATMQRDGNKPYWSQKDFQNVMVYNPDIVVIMLGTNDSKTNIWNAQSYERDYQLMIDTLNSMVSPPEIYLCLPPPAYSSNFNISDSTIRASVIPIIKGIASKNKLPVIDIYKGLSNKSELFHDGIHPNNKGKRIMAEIIAGKIIND